MFEDLYLFPEEQLIMTDFIGTYALLVHRNIIGSFLIPGPHQEANWGSKSPFLLNNPQLVNLALGLGKNKIARQIIDEVEKRRPHGFDKYPEYAGQEFPLPHSNDPSYPQDMTSILPHHWIEHQFLKITLINTETQLPAADFQGAPAMCICVLNRDLGCFDTLIESGYKPALTSNKTYVLEPVLLAATVNAYELIPKLIDIGSPFDMNDRGNILTNTSPYLTACARGNVEFVEHMLRMGYDIDEQQGGKGDTCLHTAAMKGYPRLIQFLIDKGADLTIVNQDDGQSAYSLSVQHHNRYVQALLADALLAQRLPLPPPPTLRQRLRDMERQTEIDLYLAGYMQRTNQTLDQVLGNMDIAPYDPYYDFNGTYDPNEHLGNVDKTTGSDQITKSGAVQFLVELDGILYTAGTHTYKAKMEEYFKQEEEKLQQQRSAQSREHDDLMKIVQDSLQRKHEQDQVRFEELQRMPKLPTSSITGRPAQIDTSQHIDPILKTPSSVEDISSTKLYTQYQQQQQQQHDHHHQQQQQDEQPKKSQLHDEL